MTPPWLSLVGIGADGPGGLGRRAREALAGAEVLVGGARHLALLPADGRPRLAWRSPLADSMADLLALRGRRKVAVLATGDPLWYGVGRLLLRHLPLSELEFLPHVSAFQEACARLGWPIEEVTALSLHGRPLDSLRRHLQPGRRLLALTADGDGPAAIAAVLADEGFGASGTWVLEELSGEGEQVVATRADDLAGKRFADLNLVALELAGIGRARVPGLPDDAFEHDGQVTKGEVRALTLAALGPREGELLWDVGAGAGSVAIEWLRAGDRMRAVAIERVRERAARIARNAGRLGVPELVVRQGDAPAALADLPEPDAIFVGGGVAAAGLLDLCWGRLRAGGRLVANAVTLAGEAALLAFHDARGGRLVRLALDRAEPVGGRLVWRPALPVVQLATTKPCAAASS